MAAAEKFPQVKTIIGADVNPQYLEEAGTKLSVLGVKAKTSLITGDFFSLDWSTILDSLPEPILIVGNPPWVTNAELGMLGSGNVPQKSNFQKQSGYDAKTGKSNFDISEWMLIKNLEWLEQRRGAIAVLCKSAVARKVLQNAWKNKRPVTSAKRFGIDAKEHFDASVDACLLVIELAEGGVSKECLVYKTLSDTKQSQVIGYCDDIVLADVNLYQTWQHLKGNDNTYIWRSGIKHDCSKVMEMEKCGDKYKNGFGELVALEEDNVYPLLKSSDIGNGAIRLGRKYMLVTQRFVGEETSAISRIAPMTWRYLEDHEEAFERRRSSIYRDRPRFSIFGVGPYSFAPWKIAISGFYSGLTFQIVGPGDEKAVVFDDTVYFLPCWSEAEARFIGMLLNSEPAKAFYESMIFWTDKRPVTIELLKRLDLGAVSVEMNCLTQYQQFAKERSVSESKVSQNQMALWG